MLASRTHSRRTVLGILAMAMALAPLKPGLALGQSQQTIRLNVPFTAGTGPDLLARSLGEELRQRWNQAVIVESKPGASGNIGTQAAVRAAPDGQTLLVTVNTLVILAQPNVRAVLDRQGLIARGGPSERLAALIAKDRLR